MPTDVLNLTVLAFFFLAKMLCLFLTHDEGCTAISNSALESIIMQLAIRLFPCKDIQTITAERHVVLTVFSSARYLWHRHFAQAASFESASAVNKWHVLYSWLIQRLTKANTQRRHELNASPTIEAYTGLKIHVVVSWPVILCNQVVRVVSEENTASVFVIEMRQISKMACKMIDTPKYQK
jgi:hypothetical protein